MQELQQKGYSMRLSVWPHCYLSNLWLQGSFTKCGP